MSETTHEWPLGERVREARGEESQKSVARRADIGAETLWMIENGKRRGDDHPFSPPKPGTIAKVARAVGIPVSEALTLAGYDPERHLDLLDEGRPPLLARKVAKLRPAEQRALEILVDSLLEARGHVSASGVVVWSAGEGAHADIESNGETADGAAPKQRQED